MPNWPETFDATYVDLLQRQLAEANAQKAALEARVEQFHQLIKTILDWHRDSRGKLCCCDDDGHHDPDCPYSSAEAALDNPDVAALLERRKADRVGVLEEKLRLAAHSLECIRERAEQNRQNRYRISDIRKNAKAACTWIALEAEGAIKRLHSEEAS